MMATTTETIDTLTEVLEMMDEIAKRLRSLDNRRIKAYCLADFEGQNAGWLGRSVRDILEEELESARNPEDDSE